MSENPNERDLAAARELVEGDAVLRDDPVARDIAETGRGVGGVALADVGEALDERRNFLVENPALSARIKDVRAELEGGGQHSSLEDNNI